MQTDADFIFLIMKTLTTLTTLTVVSGGKHTHSRELLQRYYDNGIYWNFNAIDFMVVVQSEKYLLV
jgi:hypothetical protein